MLGDIAFIFPIQLTTDKLLFGMVAPVDTSTMCIITPPKDLREKYCLTHPSISYNLPSTCHVVQAQYIYKLQPETLVHRNMKKSCF